MYPFRPTARHPVRHRRTRSTTGRNPQPASPAVLAVLIAVTNSASVIVDVLVTPHPAAASRKAVVTAVAFTASLSKNLAVSIAAS